MATPPDFEPVAQDALRDPPPAVDGLAEWLVAHGFRHRGSFFDVARREASHVFRRGGLAVRLAGGTEPWRVELTYRRFAEDWFGVELLCLYLDLRRPEPAMTIADQADFAKARLQEIAVLVSQDAEVGGHLRALRAIRAAPPDRP